MFLFGLLGLPFAAPAAAAPQWIRCTADETWVSPSRVHVRCSDTALLDVDKPPAFAQQEAAKLKPIIFFAASATSVATPLVLQLLIAGQTQGVTLDILTDLDDVAGTKMGCKAADCRQILQVRVRGQK